MVGFERAYYYLAYLEKKDILDSRYLEIQKVKNAILGTLRGKWSNIPSEA